MGRTRSGFSKLVGYSDVLTGKGGEREMKSIITHFDHAIFLIGLLGLTLMICGIIIQTSPYRAEFSPYYVSIVPTGVFIHVVSVVYLVVRSLRSTC